MISLIISDNNCPVYISTTVVGLRLVIDLHTSGIQILEANESNNAAIVCKEAQARSLISAISRVLEARELGVKYLCIDLPEGGKIQTL